MFAHRFRRRLLPVDAPDSLPLGQSPVPDMDALEAEVTARIGRLIDAGATDEFCAHTLDRYLEAWHAEARTSLAGLAMEQRRVDRALLDLMQARADTAERKAQHAEALAERKHAAAEQVWAAQAPPKHISMDPPARRARPSTHNNSQPTLNRSEPSW